MGRMVRKGHKRRKICGLLLAASMLLSVFSPVSVRAEGGLADAVRGLGGQGLEEIPGQGTSVQEGNKDMGAGKAPSGQEIPDGEGQETKSPNGSLWENTPEDIPEGTVVTGTGGASLSRNGAEPDGEPNGGGTTIDGLEEFLPLWDESQELMLYGLAAAEDPDAAYDEAGWKGIIDASIAKLRAANGNGEIVFTDKFLYGDETTKSAGVSNTATDWIAFGLARLGVEGEPYDAFAKAAAAYVVGKDGKLDNTDKATEWHRLTVALQAAALRTDGVDVTNIGGYNLIADGTYNCVLGEPWKQGTNGAIYALIALDTKGYEVPEGAKYGREDLIGFLLGVQDAGGGWPLQAGQGADTDITGMAVQALAPYYAGDEKVRSAVDRGLSYLEEHMKFSTDGSLGDCESTAQAIVAYTAMGIDPATVQSLSGKSLLDGLKEYYVGGGFTHTMENGKGAWDRMATEQALYAVTAYLRFLDGETALYDFREPSDTGRYVAQAGEDVYYAQTATGNSGSATLWLGEGVEKVTLAHLPIGNYDAAVVTDQAGSTYKTSFRRADGSIPVEGEIPVMAGDELKIAVTRQDGGTEGWTLRIEMDAEAQMNAVKGDIDRLDALLKAGKLTLGHASEVERLSAACLRLPEEQRKALEEDGTSGKLAALEAEVEELKASDTEGTAQARKELADKINAVKTPVTLSDAGLVNQYLADLSALGKWDADGKTEGSAALEAKLKGYQADIRSRKEAAEALDQDIWDGIDPLDISQKDTTAVNRLMARYAALGKDQQQALEHAGDLMDAADVIQSLEDGVIPARVFQNMRAATGPKEFTYNGFLEDGRAYTLTYEKGGVTGIGDIDAGLTLLEGKNIAKGAKAQVELSQEGSMNGNAKLAVESGVADGSYNVYWYNPEKLTIQSGKKAQAASGTVTMTVPSGGRYWLSDGTVALDGNLSDGSMSGVKRPSVAGTGTVITKSVTTARTALAGNRAVRSAATTSGAKSSASGSAKSSTSKGSTSGTSGSTAKRSSSTRSSTADSTGTLKAGTDGVFSGDELEQVKGTDRNLSGKGTLSDGTAYTVTINGKDVKSTDRFAFSVKSDCGHAAGIKALAEDPVILCFEDAGAFPGKLLFSMEKDGGDGTPLLFRYNPDSQEAEYVKKVTKGSGVMEFTLSEGGAYFVAERALAGPAGDGDLEEIGDGEVPLAAPDAGDGSLWDESAELTVAGTGTGTGRDPLMTVIAVAACVIAVIALGGSAFMFVKLGGPERFFKKKDELFLESGNMEGKE